MTNETNTTAEYPPLPDLDAVEQHIYGACRRYVTQDMLESIHALIRDGIYAYSAMRAAQPENAAVAGPSAPVSPMAKMALALREKSAAERNDFDRRVQSGEWGAMPEPSTEADALPNHVAEVKGDDAIRILRWSNRVGAFDYPVGTKLYATPTQPAAPPAVSQGTMNGVKTVHELHSEIKAQAECAFAQGHGFGVDYASPSDRAWIEGYAHALATHPQEATPSQDAEDAARYRWLREQSFDTWKRIAWNTYDDSQPWIPKLRDADIDAALAQA